MYRRFSRLAQSPFTSRFYSTGKPPTIPSYYALFPKTFPEGAPPAGPYKEIPARELKLEYYNLQRDHHPDRSGSNQEQATAAAGSSSNGTADSSANISVAYRTLLDPLRRAQHILATRGFDPLAEENTTEQHQHDEDNTDMLMRVMMTKEAIFDATTPAELADVQTETADQVAELVDALDVAFKADDLAKASKLVTRLSYWDGITKQLNEKLGELEPSE
jgi:molecular chaperone HscB